MPGPGCVLAGAGLPPDPCCEHFDLWQAMHIAIRNRPDECPVSFEKVKAQMKMLGALMLVLQCVPIAFIYFQKRRAAK